MTPNRRKQQPGPALQPRVVAVPCQARKLSFSLEPGAVLLDAVSRHLGNCAGAVLHLEGGGFGPFHYVIPALSSTTDHAAFYSDVFKPHGITRLESGRMTYGMRDGKPWLHCHGFLTEQDGRRSGGHVIPDATVIAASIKVDAWLLDGAAFVAVHDPETNFTLFAPQPAPRTHDGAGRYIAVRLCPNQDLHGALDECCASNGFSRAIIRGGVASIIGAVFADGATATPFATEIFIRDEIAGLHSAIDIGLVNYLGERHEGMLQKGANPVLMTAELLLEAF